MRGYLAIHFYVINNKFIRAINIYLICDDHLNNI